MVEEFSKYDMVIIQRCYLREIVDTVRTICNFVGIPMIMEVDDDYLHIEPDNPAHFSMIPGVVMDEITQDPVTSLEDKRLEVEKHRQKGLNNYKEVVGMMDGIIVSTPELKQILLPYNKNIYVLENNIEEVFAYKAYDPEHLFVKNGQVKIDHNMGMITIPSFVQGDGNNGLAVDQISPTPRIGWSSTVTHWGQDFDSISKYWERVIEKYSQHCWFVYIGWDRFVQWHQEFSGYMYDHASRSWVPDPKKKRQLPQRVLHIPDSMYDLYMFHLRNLDVGIAPLAANLFNMSKSDLKPIEYGSQKVAPVIPRLQTYTRHWKDGENCLMYTSGREFQEKMELAINDHSLRVQLGQNAYDYVKNNRLERQHSWKRYLVYKEFIASKTKLRSYTPLKQEDLEDANKPIELAV